MSVVVPITSQGGRVVAVSSSSSSALYQPSPKGNFDVPLTSSTFTNRCLSSISATPEVRHLAKMFAEEPREEGTSLVYNFVSARQAQSLVFLHTIGSFISGRAHSQAFGLLLIYTTMLLSCEAAASQSNANEVSRKLCNKFYNS